MTKCDFISLFFLRLTKYPNSRVNFFYRWINYSIFMNIWNCNWNCKHLILILALFHLKYCTSSNQIGFGWFGEQVLWGQSQMWNVVGINSFSFVSGNAWIGKASAIIRKQSTGADHSFLVLLELWVDVAAPT